MTDEKELTALIARMKGRGAFVEAKMDVDGFYQTIRVAGARGIGPYPMAPITAAERMREFLAQ